MEQNREREAEKADRGETQGRSAEEKAQSVEGSGAEVSGGETGSLPTEEQVLEEWIRTREESRRETLENYFKGMYPMMFVAGFFLLATSYQEGRRIRYLGIAGAGMPSLILTTVSFLLGAGLIFAGARIMKKQKADRMQEMEARLKELEAQGKGAGSSGGQSKPKTIAEKAAMTVREEDGGEKDQSSIK